MFEIRVICDPDDRARVSKTLANAFTTGPVREHPTRDGSRTRLYLTADHHPEPEPCPTPEEAYALAPSIISEIGWTARTARTVVYQPLGTQPEREFWLRKAAVLDRIAVADEAAGIQGDAAEAATKAAQRLMEVDGTAVTCDPRHYVRREYAHWVKHQ